MKRPGKQELWQVGAGILSVAILWPRLDELGGSEFSGGWLTGRLFEMAAMGSALILLALPLTFFFRRAATVLSLAACVLTAPLYLFFLCTPVFRAIFGGEWKGMWPPFLSWDSWKTWALVGMISLACLAWICARTFSLVPRRDSRDRTAES